MQHKKQLAGMSVEEIFENGGVDIISAMTEMMKVQQQGAIELTKLIIEYAKEEPVTKYTVFETFEEALELLRNKTESNYD